MWKIVFHILHSMRLTQHVLIFTDFLCTKDLCTTNKGIFFPYQMLKLIPSCMCHGCKAILINIVQYYNHSNNYLSSPAFFFPYRFFLCYRLHCNQQFHPRSPLDRKETAFHYSKPIISTDNDGPSVPALGAFYEGNPYREGSQSGQILGTN